jgi:hypothetical protein
MDLSHVSKMIHKKHGIQTHLIQAEHQMLGTATDQKGHHHDIYAPSCISRASAFAPSTVYESDIISICDAASLGATE